jgi:hypothetical protein
METEASEAISLASSIRFMDSLAKQFNPDLSYQLEKFRSAADDYCEEAIVLT